jgi:hypothetical protein
MRYIALYGGANFINKEGGSNFRRVLSGSAVIIEHHDYGTYLYGEYGNYEGFKNQFQTTAVVGYHFSDNYTYCNMGGTRGRNRDIEYKMAFSNGSVRIKNITTAVSSEFYYDGNGSRDWQTIVTINCSLSNAWAVAGRWIFSKKNHSGVGYFGVRRSQAKGINIFVMIGDPNSEKFQKGGAIKIVIPVL